MDKMIYYYSSRMLCRMLLFWHCQCNVVSYKIIFLLKKTIITKYAEWDLVDGLSPCVHHSDCIKAYDASAIWYWPPPLGATIATDCLRKWVFRLPSHALWCPSYCGWNSHVFHTLRSCPDYMKNASNQNLNVLHQMLEHVGTTYAVLKIKPLSN